MGQAQNELYTNSEKQAIATALALKKDLNPADFKTIRQKAADFGVRQLEDPVPQNGLVVLFSNACIHCQSSLAATDMATTTKNGTPVKWIDINTPEGQGLLGSLPGMEIKNDAYTIGGKPLKGVPATVLMENGVATKILKEVALNPGDLDILVAAQAAKSPAQGTGNMVPRQKPPEPTIPGRTF
ncbi:MAG: hypothetical protein ACKVOE_05475 [Rickettsiales bacterium]